MNRREFLAVGAGATLVSALSGCATGAACCCKKKKKKMTNKDFYIGGTFDENGINHGGKFDTAKATQAYFDLFKKLGYPVYPALADAKLTKPGLGFWAIDFAKSDFVKYGMGGVIWVDEIKEEYFGHDIYLLPLQALPEHCHLPGPEKEYEDIWTGQKIKKAIPAKMESWLVRYGWVYSFSEVGEPNLDQFPEAKANLSELLFDHKANKPTYLKSLHVEKWLPDGVAHKLPKVGSWHFLMGGTEGAVVSEFANFHDGTCNRFTVPGVAF